MLNHITVSFHSFVAAAKTLALVVEIFGSIRKIYDSTAGKHEGISKFPREFEHSA